MILLQWHLLMCNQCDLCVHHLSELTKIQHLTIMRSSTPTLTKKQMNGGDISVPINFLIYHNHKVIFNKLVDASSYSQNLWIHEVGRENFDPCSIVQIMTNNNANFKRVDCIISICYSSLFWIPCMTCCIVLMKKDIDNQALGKKMVKMA